MAEALSGTARTRATPGASGPKSNRDVDLIIACANLSDITRGYFYGTAAAPPATKADLNGNVGGSLLEADSATIVFPATGGGQNVTVRFALSQATTSGWVAGEHLYFCLCGVEIPVPGTAPDITLDLGIVGA